MNFGGTMLLEMESGSAGTDVRAIVLAGERVDRVLAEVSLGGGGSNGGSGGFSEGDLVEIYGALNVKEDATGILTEGLRLAFGQFDIALDDFHGTGGDGAFFLIFETGDQGAMDVFGDFGAGTPNQFNERSQEWGHAGWRMGDGGDWGNSEGKQGWGKWENGPIF